MIGLFLEPEDTWLFRDGRPMDAAGSRPAKSLFPPAPTVIQGVLRSHELALKKVDLGDKSAIAAAVGTADDFRSFRMSAPLIAKRNKDGKIIRYFARPADWFPTKTDSEDIQGLSPKKCPDGVVTSASDQDLPLLLYPRDFLAGKKNYGDWLDEVQLMNYLAGEPVIPIASSCLFGWETRLGIELNRQRRTANEGMIYQVEPVSLEEGVGLYVEFDGFSGWLPKGMLRMGGDNRAGRFEQVKNLPTLGLQGTLPKKFKVYFASPAYFEQGWRPASWEQFFDGDVKLQATAIARYEVLGGYDYAKHGDKASQRYVPAGSIYYFESSSPASLKQTHLTQSGAQIGFGQVIITEWK